MGSFLSVFSSLIGLLPALIAAVQAVETALPGQGQGKQKLALVLSTLGAARDVAGVAAPAVAALATPLSQVISAIVAAHNATGAFQTSNGAAASSAAPPPDPGASGAPLTD